MPTTDHPVSHAAPGRLRAAIVFLAGLLVVAVLVAPVIAADPPGRQGKPAKATEPKVPVTVSGTVTTGTDGDGLVVYRVTVAGKTWELDAGPRWFHGDNHPLKAYVGKAVTITGSAATGSTELDVETVDGKALRNAGRPPWSGGWKRVGAAHPGWSQEKADRLTERFGDCFPPGKCKHGDAAN